jgi:hypothetical protein
MEGGERYPDSADLLPISAAAQIFRYCRFESELGWFCGKESVRNEMDLAVSGELEGVARRMALARKVAAHAVEDENIATDVPGLRLYRMSAPSACNSAAYEPSLGVSTLHHQFRMLTAMSPLQYQKQLRLHVARERMLNAGLDAASAAFEVGYERASQFSREYSRFFGQPPMRDVKARRFAGVGAGRD